jgi:hypothetical protein
MRASAEAKVRPSLPASPPPAGLSRRSRARWVRLHELNDFAAHEDDQLERGLKWFDVSDALRLEAEGLRGRERDSKLKAAGDAATVALRFWRTLKFTDPAQPARRPGRPPGRPRPPVEAGAPVLGFGHA